MPILADAKDIVISQLTVKLLLSDARADDAEARVAELEEKIQKLEEQLAVKPTNGATIDQRV